MRLRSIYLAIFLFFSAVATFPVAAKEGIHATVHTIIPAHSEEGNELDVSWTLADEESGRPFNASTVFIRLIGPTGVSTEAFARDAAHSDGHYKATVKVPKGGVEGIEIGVAGTMTDREGHSERSDWVMALANDPIEK